MMRGLHSVRWRLALWYGGTLAVLLGASAGLSLVIVRRVLEDRTDHFLEESRRGFLSVLATEEREYPDTDQAIEAAIAEIGFVDTRLLVLNATGTVIGESAARGLGATLSGLREREGVIAASIMDHQRRDSLSPLALAEAIHAEAAFASVSGDAVFRVAYGPVLLHGQPFTVAAIRSRDDLVETLGRVRRAYVIAIPLVLIAATLGGYWLARRALAPVAAMARQARAISANTLHERLPLANPADELGELGGVVNEVLARLETAFTQQRRFVADASHELRTPVAVMLAESEVTLGRTMRPESDYRDSLEVIRQATLRLSRIVDDLFVLARSDGGQLSRRTETLYLDELVDDCARAMHSVATTRDVSLVVAHELPGVDGASVRGDPELLGRLVFNLIDNAVKYSPRGGRVIVSVRDAVEQWTIAVSDQGTGIPLDLQPHIFERFVRGDAARTNAFAPNGARSAEFPRASGAGLGLAIVRFVAEYHGGTIALTRSDARGSEFTASLPKHSSAPSAPTVSTSIRNVL